MASFVDLETKIYQMFVTRSSCVVNTSFSLRNYIDIVSMFTTEISEAAVTFSGIQK